MNESLTLVILFALFMLFNVLISLTLWAKYRGTLYKNLVFLWGAALLNFFVQGIFSEGFLAISYASGVGFLEGMIMMRLASELTGVSFKYGPFFLIHGICIIISSFIYFVYGAPFWAIALPISFGVVLPMFYASIKCLASKWKTISFSIKGYLISCMALGLHQLDFPFLRMLPEAVVFGFGIAMLNIFALSIFAPSAILEKVTEDQLETQAKINVAKEIQEEILPKSPNIDGLILDCYMRSADEVGGDYYDVINFNGHSWIVLGDIVGHGVGAGLTMFMIQSILMTLITTNKITSPSEMNYFANGILFKNLERLKEQRPMSIVTLVTNNGRNFKVSGSHDNIYIYRANQSKVEVKSVENFPLGIGLTDMLERESFGEDEFELHKDDILFLATDGIVEAPKNGDDSQGQFGEEALIKLIENNARESVSNLKQAIITELDTFTNKTYLDDITFIIAKAS